MVGGGHAPSLVTTPVGALVLTAAATDRRLVPARRMLTWENIIATPVTQQSVSVDIERTVNGRVEVCHWWTNCLCWPLLGAVSGG